jgi:DNA-binding transcriptional regulator YiaG
MDKTEKELSKAVDQALYGTNDAELLKRKMLKMKEQLAHERSSLGRYLESLRRELDKTFEEMARATGVGVSVWKDWEMDFATPAREELESVIRRMKWTPYRQGILWKLWGEASRFRLRRVTEFQGEFLAARGVACESGIAWQSVGEENQQLLRAWGERNGYEFPKEFTSFLRSLESNEAREAWVQDVLGAVRE